MRKIYFLFIVSVCVLASTAFGYEDIILGDECESHGDCENIPHAICDDSDVCKCADGYLASSNNSYCLPLAEKAGDKCEMLEQCSEIQNAKCLNNTCVVPPVPSSSSTTTTTIPPTTTNSREEECQEDHDCSRLLVKSVCKNGTCVSDTAPISFTTIRIQTFILGKLCSNNNECPLEGAGCVDKLCKCTENFVPSQNLKSCLPKAKSEGEKCRENAQCLGLGGSICENEKCTTFGKNFTGKLPPLRIGSTCQNDNECKYLTHALCIENVCQCKDDYITSVTSNSCLEKAKKEGDPCENDKQCEDIKGATCVQERCIKPGVVKTKLAGEGNTGSRQALPKLALAAILFSKMFSL